MASVISNLIQKLSFWSSKRSCQENEVSYQSNKSENLMTEIQKILIWDDPFLSCCCILFVNIVFWLIVYLELKFYGIIFIILLILTCEQLWTEHFSRSKSIDKSNFQNLMSYSSKTSNQGLLGCAEVNTFFKKTFNMLMDSYAKAKLLRQSQPGVFCVLTCLCFLLIGVIGKSFSGLTSFYLLLMAVMTVPGALVRLLPPDVIRGFSEIFYSNHKEGSDSEDEIEPYLMDTNTETLELLKLAGDLQLPSKEEDEESNDTFLEQISERTNDTAESVSSKFSLYPESVVMPSPESSLDFWDSDVNFWQKTESSENPKNGINFQSQHFEEDSSEEEFVKGLDLSENSSEKNEEAKAGQLNPVLTAEKLISAGKKFIGTQSKAQRPTGSDRESSSDTDSFEFISEGDL